ncbi:MAG: radical SAM family heme chaperone HemW [Chloroflexi bacterium]|nr:radical SAM family heme chaperone HemW [Chloroflexota bacterium]
MEAEFARGVVPEQGIALYIHIPFCATRCPYCDFNTYAGIPHLLSPYLKALQTEVRLWGALLGRPTVNTVFLGGGTPSLLAPGQLAALLEGVRRAFRLRDGAEVTAEANPDDVTPERLAGFRQAGVNRISMGVQSFDDGLLRLLGRRHSAGAAIQAYHMLRTAGFGNVNLDLMFGLPYQSLEQWQHTLEQAISLAPEHLSAYCLTLEAGTPMERWVKEGRLPEPDADLAADMYSWAEETLAMAGYRHYEISNWARPGCESQHNLTYWRNLPYLGVGPGAHSYLGGLRFAVLKSPASYIGYAHTWAQQGALHPSPLTAPLLKTIPVVEQVEDIGPELEMAETVILGLRLDEGVSLAAFRERFGRDLLAVYSSAVEELQEVGLLEITGGCVRLTARGRLLGNEVFVRFLGARAAAGGPRPSVIT